MYESYTDFLTLLMIIVGPILLGLAIFYLRTRGRPNWRQRRQTEAATERLYDGTEDKRVRKEEPARKTDNSTAAVLIGAGVIALGTSLGLAQVL